jgi:hypothetical protein
MMKSEIAMTRPYQPGQSVFRSILPEDIDWQSFPAFPPAVRLAVIVGHPSELGKTLMDLGFHKPGDVENRLGYYVGQLGRWQV